MDLSLALPAIQASDITNLQERRFNLWQTQTHCSFTTYKTLIITAQDEPEPLYWREKE